MLAVGPLGIFVLGCRDRHHLAVITLAAQPAEKRAFEQLGVEPVSLGTPVLARPPQSDEFDNTSSRIQFEFQSPYRTTSRLKGSQQKTLCLQTISSRSRRKQWQSLESRREGVG